MTLTESRSDVDIELVLASQAGDAAAFETLVELHRALVVGRALRVARDLDRAEDLAQDVFLAAYRSLRSLRNPASFRSWLLGIVRYRLAEFLRARRPVEVPYPDGLASANPKPEPRDETLVEALGDLPEKYRLPIVLRHMDGLDYAETARRLGLSESAARQRVHRGLERLRRRLGGRS